MTDDPPHPEGGSVVDRLRAKHGAEVDPRVDLGGGQTLPGEEPAHSPEASSGVLNRLAGHPTSSSRYRIRGEIARGGMGAILRVWDEDLRRHAAMKVAIMAGDEGSGTPASELDPRLLARFLEEAQVTGQLEHPGIVPVHELGIDDRGRAFFTMRLVRGRTLEAVFDDARGEVEGWSTTRALGVLLKVCEAMTYAHSKQVLHRDLKPANVMVGEFGEVYVMDWGLVRVRGSEDRHDVRIADSTMIRSQRVVVDRRQGESGADAESGSDLYTMDGDVLGTPSYMSIEQARGEVDALDERTDVYSVGAMLYRLLAGVSPYASPKGKRSALEVLNDLLEGPPAPLSRIDPATPMELVAICERAMARERSDRYPSMLSLAEDLRAFLEKRVVGAYETGAWAEARKWVGRNRALAASLAAGLLALTLGLAASLVMKGRADESAFLAEERRVAADLSAEEAVRQARIAEEVNSFLNDDLFASIAPEQEGIDVTVREVLEVASERLAGRFAGEPLVEARLRSTIGTSFQRLGEYEQAFTHLGRALTLVRGELGERSEETLELRRAVANVTGDLGDLGASYELLDAAISVSRDVLGPEHLGTLAMLGDQASMLSRLGRYDEARVQYEGAVEALTRLRGETHATRWWR